MTKFTGKKIRRKTKKRSNFFEFLNFFKRKKKEKNFEKKGQKNIWKYFFWGGFLFLGIAFFLVTFYLLSILKDLPDPSDPKFLEFAQSTEIFDRNGEVLLYSLHGNENRKNISISEINQNIINAVLAAEDDEFFSHPGFDIPGLTKAFCHEISGKIGLENFFGLCPRRGGSTITQQLIKNTFLTPERTMRRKLREIALAFKIEKNLSKEKILEIYLNSLSFGSSLHGVEIASQAFFGKPAKDVSAAQAAILAAIPQRPTFYFPFGANSHVKILLSPETIKEYDLKTPQEIFDFPGESYEYGLLGTEVELANGEKHFFPGRADWVLERMHLLNFLSDQEFEIAKKEICTIEFAEFREKILAPHFVMFVREELEKKFGEEFIKRGGLKVITTLNFDLQQKAETIIKEQVEKNIINYNAKNAALISLDPKSGEILTMVGSADYWNEEIDGKVNLINKKRLPGSSFKPIVYANAFMRGKLSPASILFDVKTNFGNNWEPQNFDGKFRGPVSVREALGNSLNIPAIKAAIISDAKEVYNLAEKMGISFDFDADFYGSAIALGGAEATPLQMATAYSIFANEGKKVEPVSILRVEDRFGNLLFSEEQEEQEQEQILSPEVSFLITDILSDSKARGVGWNSNLQLPDRKNAVKTGTADRKINGKPYPSDCWTIGFTPYIVTAVWGGNNRNEKLNPLAGGFSVASPIWKNFMIEAHKNISSQDFKRPDGVKQILVSRLSGKLPPENMPQKFLFKELFAPENIPTEECDNIRFIEIDSVSQKLPNDFTPPEALEKKAVLQFHSFFPDWDNWEKPIKDFLKNYQDVITKKFEIEDEILLEIPTEIDDLHNENSKNNSPKISFVSPINLGTVVPPKITCLLDFYAKNGFRSIQFFWDQKPVGMFLDSKEYFEIRVPRSDVNSEHVLRVEILDQLFFKESMEIKVKVGEDNDPPEVKIIRPTENEILPTGSKIAFFADIFDKNSAVKKVDFFIDERKIETRFFQPFQVFWESPSQEGDHNLKIIATDVFDNTAEVSQIFKLKKSKKSEKLELISPKNKDKLKCQTNLISASIPQELIPEILKVQIIAEKENFREIIDDISIVSPSGKVENFWRPPECGNWEIFVKVFKKLELPEVSKRVSVSFLE